MAPALATHSKKEILQAKLILAEAEEARKSKKESKHPAVKAEGKENKDTSKLKVEGKKRRQAAVAWADPKNHDISFWLLNIIEESHVYLVAFGFDKGQASNNSGNRKNGKEHSRSIACKLFLDPAKPDARFASFMETDIEYLGTAVKNQIQQLKEKYALFRKEMSETGHGLLEDDRENEAEEGSKLATLIQATLKKFLWYKKMSTLMRDSPIVDESAIANSNTPAKNLDMLKRKHARSTTPSRNEEDSDSVHTLSDESSEEDEKMTLTPSPVKPVSRVLSRQKRKGIQDMVADLSSANREAAVKIARIRYEQKSTESMEKERIKCQSALDMEHLRLEHQRNEGVAQQAHELAMLERQIELEQLRHASSATPLNYQPAASQWNFGIDPNLQ